MEAIDGLAILKALGFKISEFERRSGGVASETLARLKTNPSSIKPTTKAKILATLTEMKQERERLVKQVLSA